MPAYNAAEYIAEAITSVLDQTFTDFELLIVNDGSTDDTVEVIRSFEDERIVLVNRPNGGVSEALNTGLRHARAGYIARFDADDICHPERLEIQYGYVRSDPRYHILGSAADYVDMHGNYVFTYQPPAHSDEHIRSLDHSLCPFIHSTVFYRKDVVLSAGGYNKYALGFEDHLLWRNIAKEGKVFNFSRSLIKVRLNPGSVTIDEKWSPKEFRKIKYSALRTGIMTEAQGTELRHIARTAYSPKVKHGAYYALLAKKYLWNNHQPEKARQNLREVLKIDRFNLSSYALLALSFIPERSLIRLYNMIR